MRGISDAMKNMRGKGRITEANVQEGLRQVRTALLEADVNFNVANEFMERVKQQARATGFALNRSERTDRQHHLSGAGSPDEGGCRAARAGVPFRQGSPDGIDAVRHARIGQDDDVRQAGDDAARPLQQKADDGRCRLATTRGDGSTRKRLASSWGSTVYAEGRGYDAGQPGQGLPERGCPGQETPATMSSFLTPPAGSTSPKCRWRS